MILLIFVLSWLHLFLRAIRTLERDPECELAGPGTDEVGHLHVACCGLHDTSCSACSGRDEIASVGCEVDAQLATTEDTEDTDVKSLGKRACSSVPSVPSVVES